MLSDRKIAAIDIVEREKHETSCGSARVGVGSRPRIDGEGALASDPVGADTQDSLSKSEDTDREGPSGAHASFETLDLPDPLCRGWGMGQVRLPTEDQKAGWGSEPVPRAKGPVFFWIGSSAIRAFGGCLGSKRR